MKMDSINGVLCILISTVKIGFSSVISASGLPIFFSTHPLGTSQFSYRYASLRLTVPEPGDASAYFPPASLNFPLAFSVTTRGVAI